VLLKQIKMLYLLMVVGIIGATVVTPPTAAAELTADQIVAKSEGVYPGMDAQSKLTFTIRDPDGKERKVILRRYWKNYSDDEDIDSKVLVFHEYPPAAMTLPLSSLAADQNVWWLAAEFPVVDQFPDPGSNNSFSVVPNPPESPVALSSFPLFKRIRLVEPPVWSIEPVADQVCVPGL